MNENLKPVEKLTPFTKMIMTIGTLPSSFYASMSYYESMVWLYEYLKNEVIPAVNNNGEAVEELQTAFITLKTWIENYFENLDVQEEINHKLDEMALDGTLTNLIKGYVDPIYEAYETKINGKLDDQDLEISNFKLLVNGKLDDQDLEISNFKTDVNANLALQDSKINNLEGANPIFVSLETDMTNQDAIYVLTTNNHIYQYVNGSFTDTGAVYSSQDDTFQISSNLINYSNYATLLPDLNNATENAVYSLLFALYTEQKPSNLPCNPTGNIETLIVNKTTDTQTIKQIYFSQNDLYIRYKYASNAWTTWNKLTNLYNINYTTLIDYSNFSSLLPDLDNITDDKYYELLFNSNAQPSRMPANLPAGGDDAIDTLLHLNVTNNRAIQIYYNTSSIYYRFKWNGTWRAWNKLIDQSKIITIGSGETYTTLKEGIAEAIKYPNSIVYVKPGTYDLFTEFGGNDFFNAYTSSSSKGIYLSNGVHVIFSSRAKAIFHNTTENTTIDEYFSVFNAGIGGYTLENATIECSRCRYALHDERGGSTDTYITKILNCNMTKDNTNGGSFYQCIGGGLGHDGEIIIQDCILSNPNASSTDDLLSYHNDWNPVDNTSKSNIVIKNNYFKEGTFRLSWCGTATTISNCILTNNKLNSSPKHVAEGPTHTTLNTELIAWNNITN